MMKPVGPLTSPRRRRVGGLIAAGLATAWAAVAAGLPPLPVAARELAESEEQFAPFARAVSAHVEERLAGAPPPAELKTLLSLRVHLALHFADDARALETAARIRESQTGPGDRAVSGLVTRAIVEARGGRRSVGPSMFAPDVERALARRLAALPRTDAVRAAVRRSRDRIAAITEKELRAELARDFGMPAGEPCTLELADRLVRIRHRLTLIVPLGEAMLRAHESALAGLAAK